MGMDVTHPGPLGHAFDVAMNGAPIEGLPVVTFDKAARAARSAECPVVGDELDQLMSDRHVAVVVQLADGDPQREGVTELGHRLVVETRELTHPDAGLGQALRP